MNTTNIFVELVIIGLGAMVGFFLFIALIFNINLLNTTFVISENFPSIITSLIILTFIYLFGILIDRSADVLLTKAGDKLRAIFFTKRDEVLRAKIKTYKIDPAFAAIFEYNRSRMRICRGWIINSFLILISSNLYLWLSPISFKDTLNEQNISLIGLSIFVSLVMIFILIGCFYFWKSLQSSEYAKLSKVDELIPDKS